MLLVHPCSTLAAATAGLTDLPDLFSFDTVTYWTFSASGIAADLCYLLGIGVVLAIVTLLLQYEVPRIALDALPLQHLDGHLVATGVGGQLPAVHGPKGTLIELVGLGEVVRRGGNVGGCELDGSLGRRGRAVCGLVTSR